MEFLIKTTKKNSFVSSFIQTSLTIGCLMVFGSQQSFAADLQETQRKQVREIVAQTWQIRVTPYAWLMGLNGHQTIRGRSVDVNASFTDIVESTIGKGGSLFALTMNVEARHGPYVLFGDFVGANITAERNRVVVRNPPSASVSSSVSTSVDIAYKTVIAEVGGGYEIAKTGTLAFDVLAGARFWYQNADVRLGLSAGLDVADLNIVGDRASMKSGSVSWVDGFAGARMRWAFAPGHEVSMRGDIGGGGSRFSWQGIVAYNVTIAERNNVIYKGIIGYRALHVDYAKGSERERYRYDVTTHGPLIGLQIIF